MRGSSWNPVPRPWPVWCGKSSRPRARASRSAATASGPDRRHELGEHVADESVRLTRGGARLADREGRTRVAPVAGDPGDEIAEDEIARREGPDPRRAADLDGARSRDEVGEHRQPALGGDLHRPSHLGPQVELGDPGHRIRPRGRLPRVAHGDRGPDQLHLVRILDGPSLHELLGDVHPVDVPCERSRQVSRVDRDAPSVENRGERLTCSGDGVNRPDPEAGVQGDLAPRRRGGVRFVLADDEQRSAAPGQHGDRREGKRARSGLDLRRVAGQPGDRGRVGDDEAARLRRVEDLDRPLSPRPHQNVTVSPPSTVSTWPVM